MTTLIRHIAQLAAVPRGPVRGAAFSNPPIVLNAALLIEDGRIAAFGPQTDFSPADADEVIDAGGGTVIPGLVDCHTHAVFAGSREREFVQRLRGATYLEILESGGGIHNTVQAVRAASEDELVSLSRPRLERMLAAGTTTVEIKSGYGLTPEDELKMLRAARRLGELLPMDVVTTWLAAHALPAEFKDRPDEYLDAMTEPELLRRARTEGGAEFADVFCERGAFTLEQSRRYLTACKNHGLIPKIHSEQITFTGATKLAAELDAVSADHLECIDDSTIQTLTKSATIPVLLPGCSFFLGTPPADARKLIDAGLPVALATDCNPGSSRIETLHTLMAIAASLLRMTPAESLVACTANAAAALRRADRIGAIAVGHQADLLILDVPNLDRWVYQTDVPAVRTVIKKGRVVFNSSTCP